jgi:hypothetical protein
MSLFLFKLSYELGKYLKLLVFRRHVTSGNKKKSIKNILDTK